ncbi:GTP-binding protein [Streptomyces sp. NPDC126499]|uniref:GTP-binding protein n=1 Tax=Streptomyces sp. NPDC126499 TaxID=3155314 RepID=UPI003325FDA3
MKPQITIATIGHSQHGRTSLTSAITTVLAQRHPELNTARTVQELAAAPTVKHEGISMRFSQVTYESEKRAYTHVDFPTTGDFVRAVTTGAVRPDGVLLAVDASAGGDVETRESVLFAAQAGIPQAVAALTKCDLQEDAEKLELVELELREMLSANGFPGDDLSVTRTYPQDALNGDQSAAGSLVNLVHALDENIAPAAPAADKPTQRFQATICLRAAEDAGRPVYVNARPRIGVDGREEETLLRLPGGLDSVPAGEYADVTFEMPTAVGLRQGKRFTLRDPLGAGIVTAILD